MARPLSSELIAEVIPSASPPERRRRSRRSSSTSPTAFGISRAELVGSSRAATPLRARQVAIFLTRELTDLSLPQIGRLYGGRDHSTVLNSLRRVEAAPRRGPELAERRSRSCATAIHNPATGDRPDGRRTVRINAFPQPPPQPRNRVPTPNSPPGPAFSTSPNPTQEGIHHLKLTTKREELVSKLSVVSRAVSTRAATQALSGILLTVADGRRDAARRPTSRWGCETDARGRGRGRAARSCSRAACSPRSPARSATTTVRDRAARGRARRRDPQRRLQLPPARPARRGLPEASRSRGERAADDPGRGAGRDGRLVARAASRDDMRPVLTGVLVSASGSEMTMVATDSYRLGGQADRARGRDRRRARGEHPGPGAARAGPDRLRRRRRGGRGQPAAQPGGLQGRGDRPQHEADRRPVPQLSTTPAGVLRARRAAAARRVPRRHPPGQPAGAAQRAAAPLASPRAS